MAEIDAEGLQQHLQQEGFSTGKVGMGEALHMLKSTVQDSALAGWLSSVKDGIHDGVRVCLDVFHVNTKTIRAGDFSSTVTAEYELLRSKATTLGELFDLVRAGKLPMVTMMIISTVVALVLSTWFLEIVLKLFGRVDELSGVAAAERGKAAKAAAAAEEEEEKTPPRDFTIEQLRAFDGTTKDGPTGHPETSPIYISVRGNVYDVSSATDFYGPGSAYHCMAGREASKALAKLSFEESDLADTDLSDLGPFQRETLDGWEEKFVHYKCYPVVGKCVFGKKFGLVEANVELPIMTVEHISQFKGLPDQPVPAGRINAPIYLGICGLVLDVSFGGIEMYGPGGPYHLFAGIDASRALAKMSFDDSDTGSRDLSGLTEEQKKTLEDWRKRFVEVKGYPIVGSLAL